MFLFTVVSILFSSVPSIAQRGSLPVLDPISCVNMCQSREVCPENAACMPIPGNQLCGICICTFGYQPVGNTCVEKPTEQFHARSELLPPQPSLRVQPRVSPPLPVIARRTTPTTVPHPLPLPPSPPSPPAQPTPDSPSEEWNCSDFDCPRDQENEEGLSEANSDCFYSPPKRCVNLQGAAECHGTGQCLKVEEDAAVCVCPYRRAGISCHIEKPNRCQLTTGVSPAAVKIGFRFAHIRIPHTGAIHGRHFAPNLEHCVRLCEWAGPARCRSVNYGPINGQLVCELLTIRAPESSPLFSWLKKEPGWTYACCFQ